MRVRPLEPTWKEALRDVVEWLTAATRNQHNSCWDAIIWRTGAICHHTPHKVQADLYGHLQRAVIAAHAQNLSFVDFTECTMAKSPDQKKKKEREKELKGNNP